METFFEGDARNDCCAEIAASEDQSALISCTDVASSELYSQIIDRDRDSVAAANEVMQSSSDGRHMLRSSSYEDIYVGTKLPGDEPSDSRDYVVDVSDIGDRFDSRPACTTYRKQSGKSSSFENLYEMQKLAAFAGDSNEMEHDGESYSSQQWQIRDSSEDVSEKDSVLAAMPSLIGEALKSSPIDITVESGLDRVGQSAGYSRKPKKRLPQLLQHSVSYDLDPDKRHREISSGSSLDGNDDGVDFQRGRNTTSGIGNGCRCTE